MVVNNKPDQGASTNQAQNTKAEGTVQPTLEELQKEYLLIKENAEKDRIERERLSLELETKKKELSSRDSKITEYQQAIKQKELETLDEKERAKREIEIALEEKKRIESEVNEARRQRLIDKVLFDSGLPIEFTDKIKGQTEEEIKTEVDKFNKFINGLVESRVEKVVNERLAGKNPSGNAQTPALNEREKLVQEYNEAEKKGDARAMMIIKDRIRALPKQ